MGHDLIWFMSHPWTWIIITLKAMVSMGFLSPVGSSPTASPEILTGHDCGALEAQRMSPCDSHRWRLVGMIGEWLIKSWLMADWWLTNGQWLVEGWLRVDYSNGWKIYVIETVWTTNELGFDIGFLDHDWNKEFQGRTSRWDSELSFESVTAHSSVKVCAWRDGV